LRAFEKFRRGRKGIPRAKAQRFGKAERPKAEALGYLEASRNPRELMS
jgi:hypothetical protein